MRIIFQTARKLTSKERKKERKKERDWLLMFFVLIERCLYWYLYMYLVCTLSSSKARQKRGGKSHQRRACMPLALPISFVLSSPSTRLYAFTKSGHDVMCSVITGVTHLDDHVIHMYRKTPATSPTKFRTFSTKFVVLQSLYVLPVVITRKATTLS